LAIWQSCVLAGRLASPWSAPRKREVMVGKCCSWSWSLVCPRYGTWFIGIAPSILPHNNLSSLSTPFTLWFVVVKSAAKGLCRELIAGPNFDFLGTRNQMDQCVLRAGCRPGCRPNKSWFAVCSGVAYFRSWLPKSYRKHIILSV